MGADGLPFMYSITGFSRTCSAIMVNASSSVSICTLRFGAKSSCESLEKKEKRDATVPCGSRQDETERRAKERAKVTLENMVVHRWLLIRYECAGMVQ